MTSTEHGLWLDGEGVVRSAAMRRDVTKANAPRARLIYRSIAGMNTIVQLS